MAIKIEPLVEALVALREAVHAGTYPLDAPGADTARHGSTELITQLDEYLLPRLRHLAAPMIAVVGGSTGAGKSTLVNSLVRAPVSPTGVLRPTTRAPVLVCHPADAPWFTGPGLLPGLAHARDPEPALQVISAPGLVRGLAVVDAPDIDSVVTANRDLAQRLFDAADLWLFVTTSFRYADAVPWQTLRRGDERSVAVGVVLDRVPPQVKDELTGHLRQMLDERGMAEIPVFPVEETRLDGQGMLTESDVAEIQEWLTAFARAPREGRISTWRTLAGALTRAGHQIAGLVKAAEEQQEAASHLIEVAGQAHSDEAARLAQAIDAGTALRGESLTRLRQLATSGALRRALRLRPGRRVTTPPTASGGRAAPGERFYRAAESSLATLIHEAAAKAATQTMQGWQSGPVGIAGLASRQELTQVSMDLYEQAVRLVQDWRQWIPTLVRAEPSGRRGEVRPEAVSAATLLVTIAALAPPVSNTTTSESPESPRMLRAVTGDPVIARLTDPARTELVNRIQRLLDEQATRLVDLAGIPRVAGQGTARLRTAALGVSSALAGLPAVGADRAWRAGAPLTGDAR